LQTIKEIGGYMDFERFHGPMLHEDGIKLNCGRNCLAYLIRSRNIKKIALPYFLCDSVFEVCNAYHVEMRFYHVSKDLRPLLGGLDQGEWIYLMNYYGQLTRDDIIRYAGRYGNIIVDNTQAYFEEPIDGIDTLYTCRKFFGVPDGAILYTNSTPLNGLEVDISTDHMEYLLGRFEHNASMYYAQSIENNQRFRRTLIKRMSKLTNNLLHGIDYVFAQDQRTKNYSRLHHMLQGVNQLKLSCIEGAFAYPFLIENGVSLRKKMIESKIYVPLLWPNVLKQMNRDTVEYRMAANILPLPCDHRYNEEDMDHVAQLINQFIG